MNTFERFTDEDLANVVKDLVGDLRRWEELGLEDKALGTTKVLMLFSEEMSRRRGVQDES